MPYKEGARPRRDTANRFDSAGATVAFAFRILTAMRGINARLVCSRWVERAAQPVKNRPSLARGLGVTIDVLRMLEFFTTYLQSGQIKPSSLDRLVALGARPLPDQRESLRNSVRYWAQQNGCAGGLRCLPARPLPSGRRRGGARPAGA